MNGQYLNNYSSKSIKTLQTGLVHLLMQNIYLSRLDTRSQALFNEIMICTIFIYVNAIQKLLSHEFILITHGYDQRVSKVDLHLPGL